MYYSGWSGELALSGQWSSEVHANHGENAYEYQGTLQHADFPSSIVVLESRYSSSCPLVTCFPFSLASSLSPVEGGRRP